MEFQTLKQSHLKRNIIIGVGIILIISAVILNFTKAKYRVTESIPLVNGTINYTLPDLNIVGLYIDGVEATELDSSKSYTLDTANSTCTYKDGTAIDNLTLSYDSDTKAFSITPYTTKGTKCTLYFEAELLPVADTILGLYETNTEVMAYDDYNNLRYIGANPNNYVSFNGELWRIIGVFGEDTHGVSNTKLIKLIRNESIGNYSWDYDASVSYGLNDWSTSQLQELLNNGAYYNRTSGIYYNDSTTATTIDFSSTGLTEEAKSMIETVTWKLGGSSTYNDVTASMFYERERGTTVYSGRPTTWTGKVGLMYPSDYGYATSGGTTTDRSTCLAKELFNWDTVSDCRDNDWLYESSYNQWTITQDSSISILVFRVDDTGFVHSNVRANTAYGVRPSVYLTSTVVITSGEGTSSNPYILGGN